MGKPRFAGGVCGRESLSVRWVVVSILVVMQVSPGGAMAQSGQSDQDRMKAPVVQYLMDTGTKQYQRGYYEEAEKTFLQAQGYQQYLNTKERQHLEDLLNKTHQAALARKEGAEGLRTAETLVVQNKAAEARVILERIKDNRFLTAKDRQRVAELLASNGRQTSNSESLTDKLKKTTPFNSNPSDPSASAVTAYDPFRSAPAADEAVSSTLASSDPAVAAGMEPLASAGGQDSMIDVIKRKQVVIRDHVRAVVSDTRVKVNEYVGTNQYDAAQGSVGQARALVETNRQYLGPDLTQFYTTELAQMDQAVAKAREQYTWEQESLRRRASTEIQQRDLQRQDIEKQKAIIELLERAKAYRDQRRYEAALAQVEAVLARDPLHNEALKLKRQIEDLSHLRKQMDTEQEYGREQANTAQKVDEAQVPYAGELTYAKNWKEIDSKPTRKEDRPVELDPANMQVYAQLDQIVDLSMLNPQMPFSEAVDKLRNAVTPPLRIVVLWRDLENAAEPILPSDPIGMDGLSQVKLIAGLESLLAAVSGGLVQLGYAPVGYAVDGGIVKVATTQSLPKRLETRVYDISDLITEQTMMTQMNGMMTSMRLMQAYSQFMMSASMAQQIAPAPSGTGTGTSGTTGTSGMGGGMMGGMGGGGGGYGSGGQGGQGGGMGRGGSYDITQLSQLIENTIAPDSWYDTSDYGEGIISVYPAMGMGMTMPKKLAITNTREVHRQVEQLLDELRKSLGPQVMIEARFLTVSKGFMEEIGLDADMTLNKLGGKWNRMTLTQDSVGGTRAKGTEIPGSVGNIPAALLAGGSYGSALNALQVDYLLRAAQARNDTKTLGSPRATVMSGDPAIFNLSSYFRFALPPETQQTFVSGLNVGTTGSQTSISPQYTDVTTGNSLQITPTISKDKKHVLLTIDLIRARLVGIRSQDVQTIAFDTAGIPQPVTFHVELPETESAGISTRVSVPDQGTLLLGGQTVTTEVEKQSGVPILSKIPIIGRAFSSTSTVKDQQVLLLLVKPIIILQNERDMEALAEAEAREAHAF